MSIFNNTLKKQTNEKTTGQIPWVFSDWWRGLQNRGNSEFIKID